MASIYSFSLTGKSYSKPSPDQVIKITMNKQPRNRGCGGWVGWVGFTKNLSIIYINILSRLTMLYIKEKLQQTIHLKKPFYRHPELCQSRMKKDLQTIHNVKLALEEWDTDTWELKSTKSSITLL